MRGLSVLCFLLALPALAALGHDIYITYQDQDFTKTMMFSDVGFLWTRYGPESYKWAQDNLGKETWDGFLTPLLEQTTVIVAVIPALLVYTLLLLLKLLNFPPFSDGTKTFGHFRKKGNFSFSGTDKSQGKFRYKRK